MKTFTPTTAARLATEVDQGRKELIQYLQGLPVADVVAAGQAVKLPRFADKLHSSGDVSTSMLVKIINQLSLTEGK